MSGPIESRSEVGKCDSEATMFRFSIRDILWATLVVGLVLAWADYYRHAMELHQGSQIKASRLEARNARLEAELQAAKEAYATRIASRSSEPHSN